MKPASAYALLCMVWGLAACTPGTFMNLSRNVAEAQKTALVSGRVANQEGDNTQIIVVALTGDDEHLAAYNYSRVFERDRYVLRIESSKPVLLAAFADRNRNLRYEPGEPAAVLDARLTAASEEKALQADLALAAGANLRPGVSKALAAVDKIERKVLSISLGDIADIDDPRFTPELGSKGLWAPLDFATEIGTGVFFLEPYDPGRIPVLFVSGAGGYPREWKSFVQHLDRKVYQPWVFLYPSGARLANSAQLLNGCVRALHERYRFLTLFVTAHSMGGLVSRGFILRSVHLDHQDYVKLFVSISTPWHGHEGAKYGVEYAPATVPSWIDMQVDSDYQKSVFSQTLGARTPYYLLYGYLDPSIPEDEADDGAVTVTSQLYPQARREAVEVLGFQADHEAILESDAVMRVYQGILDKTRAQIAGAETGRPKRQ